MTEHEGERRGSRRRLPRSERGVWGGFWAPPARGGRNTDDANRELPAFDGVLLAAVLALTAIGCVMVYSASAVTAQQQLGDGFHLFKRQLVAVGLGLGLAVLALRVGHRRLEALAYPLLVSTVVLLLLVLVPGIGKVAGGARRWIDLGVVRFQPAELAKVALVLYLARSIARKREKMRLFSIGFLPHVLVTLLLVGLCLAERDLGTGVILFLVLFAMLFAAGAKVAWLLGALIVGAPAVWHVIASTPYRRERILAFLDPWAYRDGVGFQLVESLLGIGNGGPFGQGLGQGKGKLFYLPAAPTDFIAAVIAEETGLVGMTVLLALFGVLLWRGTRAAVNASEPFGCYLAVGLTTLFGTQAIVNLAVVFGLLPTKGLTLPFVSYGGSSIMTLLGAAGVLLSVSADRGGFLRRPANTARGAGASTSGPRPAEDVS